MYYVGTWLRVDGKYDLHHQKVANKLRQSIVKNTVLDLCIKLEIVSVVVYFMMILQSGSHSRETHSY